LSGEVLKYLQKHGKYLLFLFFLAVVYIGNGLILALEIDEKRDLEEKLVRSKAKYNLALQKINEQNSYPHLKELIEKYNIGLKESESPPIRVEK